jgi:hypothetical protein
MKQRKEHMAISFEKKMAEPAIVLILRQLGHLLARPVAFRPLLTKGLAFRGFSPSIKNLHEGVSTPWRLYNGTFRNSLPMTVSMKVSDHVMSLFKGNERKDLVSMETTKSYQKSQEKFEDLTPCYPIKEMSNETNNNNLVAARRKGE